MDEKKKAQVAYMVVYGDRDDAMFWIDLYACKCLHLLWAMEPWYKGASGASEPTETLSSYMRPGTDSAHGIVHRMMTFHRRAGMELTKEGELFVRAVEDMNLFFDELKRVFTWVKIVDVKATFGEVMSYCMTAKKLRHSEERFSDTLKAKIEAFLAGWGELYDLCLTEECVRRDVPDDNAYDRHLTECIEEMEGAIVMKKGKGRPLGVSKRTKCWLIDSWYYLIDHPDACRANVAGVKVTYLDFWETYENALREKGLASYDTAVRALKTALANARAGMLGEAYRTKTQSHAR